MLLRMFFVIALLLVFAPVGIISPVGTLPALATAQTLTTDPETETLSPEALSVALEPRTLGDANAKVTLAEYSSLSCTHCAHLHRDVFPQIKAAYIDTGKVFFTYHDMPTSAPGLSAAMLARCADKERYFEVMSTLFASQDSWAFSSNWHDLLRTKAIALGIKNAEACLTSPGLKSAIVEGAKKDGALYAIDATPSFVINGQIVMRGAKSYEEFAKVLDTALDAAPAQP